MAGAKRRINSTGRKRIRWDLVDIRLLETNPGEALRAQASLELAAAGFPDDARVSIEAYHRSSGMRFDCGTVGELNIPPVLVLDEVDRSGSTLFRVKVTDTTQIPGLLLGSAERIQPRSDESDEGRRSIFPVRETDIGHLVWRVSVDSETSPVLELNNRIPGLKQKILEDPLLQGTILPEALRRVAVELASDPSADYEDETDWKAEWFSYIRDELEVAEDPSELTTSGDKFEWVEDVVRRFCEGAGFVAQIRSKGEEVVQ